jgi:hypothetical protein
MKDALLHENAAPLAQKKGRSEPELIRQVLSQPDLS